MKPRIRQAAWAGQFYPAQPAKLKEMIQSYLQQAPKDKNLGKVLGLVAPHAGYIYSGRTAAAAYKQIKGQKITTVVIVSPSHAQYLEGVSIFDGEAYATPLGQVAVDQDLVQQMVRQSPMLRQSSEGHEVQGERAEHALEVQLPFLQMVLPESFKVVPIVFHDYSLAVCQTLGEALARIYHPEMLIVASSDLYHGYSYEECKRADQVTIAAIESGRAKEFCLGTHQGIYHACGAGPVAALLSAAEKMNAPKIKTLAMTNSADVTGARSGWTVGYASMWIGWPE